MIPLEIIKLSYYNIRLLHLSVTAYLYIYNYIMFVREIFTEQQRTQQSLVCNINFDLIHSGLPEEKAGDKQTDNELRIFYIVFHH